MCVLEHLIEFYMVSSFAHIYFLINVNDVFASAKCLWIHFIFIIRWNRTITFNVKIYGHINPNHIIYRLISKRIEKFNGFFPVSSEFYLDELKIFVCTYPKNGSSSKSPPIKDPNIFCCCFWFDSISNSHQIILFSTSHSHAQLVTEKKKKKRTTIMYSKVRWSLNNCPLSQQWTLKIFRISF